MTVEHPPLLETGIYTIPEAAELVAAERAVVRVWVEGRGEKQEPVIDNQIGRIDRKVAVSFTNLMELRFVACFANAGVRLNEIRRVLDEARRLLRHPHPFATNVVFKTDGKKIVAELLTKAVGKNGERTDLLDLKSKNFEMAIIVMQTLKEDVKFDPKGEAIYWKPRPTIAPNVIVHPMYAFGKPVLKASRIPTETLARAYKAEGSLGAVANSYEVSEAQVREAVSFEKHLRKAA